MKTQTLRLTSPLSQGPLVSKTQRLLVKGGFYAGKVDGVYGPETSAAARRAKHALGYPDKLVNGDAGDKLRGYLAGAAVPRAYAIEAKRRASVRAGLGKLAIELAATFIGYKERPAGSNRNQFGAWYGADGWPWCAEFVSYVLAHSGFKYVSPHDARWAYCPYVVRDARDGHFGLSVVAWGKVAGLVKPDADGNRACVLALYDWDNDGVADHIGFVEEVFDGVSFAAIEGNTSQGNNSNGGEVMRRDRDVNDVQAFVLVAA